MSEHKLHECDGRCRDAEHVYSCNYCDGGLASCDVCGGAEASLPTHCPGKPMSHQEQDEVAAGVLDFVDGQWQLGKRGEAFVAMEEHRARVQ